MTNSEPSKPPESALKKWVFTVVTIATYTFAVFAVSAWVVLINPPRGYAYSHRIGMLLRNLIFISTLSFLILQIPLVIAYKGKRELASRLTFAFLLLFLFAFAVCSEITFYVGAIPGAPKSQVVHAKSGRTYFAAGVLYFQEGQYG